MYVLLLPKPAILSLKNVYHMYIIPNVSFTCLFRALDSGRTSVCTDENFPDTTVKKFIGDTDTVQNNLVRVLINLQAYFKLFRCSIYANTTYYQCTVNDHVMLSVGG